MSIFSALNVVMEGDCACNWTLVPQDACILCTDQSPCVIRNGVPSRGIVVHIVLWVAGRNVPTLNTLLRRPPGFPNFGAGGPGAGGLSMPPNFGGPAAQSSPVDTTARTVGACHDKHCAATLGFNCVSRHALHHSQEQPGRRKREGPKELPIKLLGSLLCHGVFWVLSILPETDLQPQLLTRRRLVMGLARS